MAVRIDEGISLVRDSVRAVIVVDDQIGTKHFA